MMPLFRVVLFFPYCVACVLMVAGGCTGPSLPSSGSGSANRGASEAESPDTDADGIPDASDNCLNAANADQLNSDGDSFGDVCDGCPQDAAKSAPGVCGCGVPDTEEDSDLDGVVDCVDACPDDPAKSDPGKCGCGLADNDSDGDGTLDCHDGCPDYPEKTAPGACGCGAPDDDSDGDGTLDCNDDCPSDPAKTAAGACGCGVPDDDSDGDGALDCDDECPGDSEKTAPGMCGCGVPDEDSDDDGITDCLAEVVVPGVGHDGVTLAKTPSEIIAILGEPETQEDNQTLWLVWWESHGIDVLFTGDPRLASEIRYNVGTELKLSVGPGIGTSQEGVFAVFGAPVETREVEGSEGLFDDRVLYQLTNGASKIIYQGEGVLFWFDEEDAISQFVVFPIGP